MDDDCLPRMACMRYMAYYMHTEKTALEMVWLHQERHQEGRCGRRELEDSSPRRDSGTRSCTWRQLCNHPHPYMRGTSGRDRNAMMLLLQLLMPTFWYLNNLPLYSLVVPRKESLWCICKWAVVLQWIVGCGHSAWTASGSHDSAYFVKVCH